MYKNKSTFSSSADKFKTKIQSTTGNCLEMNTAFFSGVFWTKQEVWNFPEALLILNINITVTSNGHWLVTDTHTLLIDSQNVCKVQCEGSQVLKHGRSSLKRQYPWNRNLQSVHKNQCYYHRIHFITTLLAHPLRRGRTAFRRSPFE